MQLVILLANNFSWQIIAKCLALPGITSVIRKRNFFLPIKSLFTFDWRSEKTEIAVAVYNAIIAINS